MNERKLDKVFIGTGWRELEIISEPFVVLVFKGYAPVVKVRDINFGQENILYISAKSIATKLEEFLGEQRLFNGLRFKIRRESEDKMSKYEIEKL